MSTPMLSVVGLNAFYGRAHILFDVSFAVQRGEVMALLGRNGAGKSTTLKSIIGLVRPIQGHVLFAGERIETEPSYRISRRGLGYVPEDRRIFTELTVTENLDAGRRAARVGAASWTLEQIFELFPNLADMKNRPGGRMSGGEQQMLSIARTLMGNPSAVLLDEPSEGLAPKIVEGLAAMIRTLKSHGLTIVLSEQNLHFATSVADTATIIEKGRIRYSGTMAQLTADKAMQQEFLGL
jgi:branched-chain amino acid transport system ATP-binding protein